MWDTLDASAKSSSLQCATRVLSFCDSSLGRLAKKEWTETWLSHASSSQQPRPALHSASAHRPSVWCPMLPPPTTAHSPNPIFRDIPASFTLTSCHFPSGFLFARNVISGLSPLSSPPAKAQNRECAHCLSSAAISTLPKVVTLGHRNCSREIRYLL